MGASWKTCGTLVLLAAVGAILGFVIFFMTCVRIKDGDSFEAETKQNLHAIQLALERYAVDYGGIYPLYLIGGEGRWAARVSTSGGRATFSESEDCPDALGLSDPLAREGYMPAYADNPFVWHSSPSAQIHQAQLTWPLSPPGGDPLRNGCEAARLLGTRFGADCSRMGNVLPDKCYPYWTYRASGGETEQRHTWCDVEYHLWDIWQGDKPKPYLPGEFFYRSVGQPRHYCLGAYGDPRHKGDDVLSSTGDPYGKRGRTLSGEADLDAANGIPDGICFILDGEAAK
jgi:hypothetical protein